MHLDPDIFYMAVTAAIFLIVGIPQIRRAVWMPRDLQFQDVPEDQLTPAQIRFITSHDQTVAELGYRVFKTYRIPNMLGQNLIRVYLNPTDPAKCVLCMVGMKKKGNSLFTSYTEFATKYADDTHLVVNNNKSSGIFDDLPGMVTFRYNHINNLAELKRRHDQEADKLRQRGIVFYSADNYFDDFRQFHQKYCEHQQSKKLLYWDSKSGVYRGTTRMAFRGIRNYLNPFGARVSPLRFAAGVVLGAGIPLLATLNRVEFGVWLATHGVNGMTMPMLPLIAYGVAGMAVGILFSRRTFVWAILLGILPGRLLWGVSELGYGLWMASVADVTGRAANRRKNIL